MTERDERRERLWQHIDEMFACAEPSLTPAEVATDLRTELKASCDDRQTLTAANKSINELDAETLKLRADLCREQQALAHERFLNGNLRADLTGLRRSR